MSDFPLLPVLREGDELVVETPAKLNLFLEIEGKRDDGYHDLVTLLLAVDLVDTLRAAVLPAGEPDTLRVEGEAAPEDESNLVLRALAAARRARPVPPLALHLSKRIPAGAGLGGGSGNAAGLLALLESVAPDPGGVDAVRAIGAQIGSDVPFFLGDAVAAVARGRGERLEPFPGRLCGGDDPAFILVMPAVVSSTADAYRRIAFPLTNPDGPITFPVTTFASSGEWQEGLFNRLEGPVLNAEPALAELARRLRGITNRTAAAGRESSAERDRGGDRAEDLAGDRRSAMSSSGAGSTLGPNSVRMTGSGSAFFIALGDRERSSTVGSAILAQLRSPDGPLSAYCAETCSAETCSAETCSAETGIPVRSELVVPRSAFPRRP